MSAPMLDDLLATLRGEKLGRGRVGGSYDPTPSTRGIREASGPGGRRPEHLDDREWFERVDLARRRLADGRYTVDDVAIVRERTRTPWTLTNAVPCGEECPHRDRPRHYHGVEIGESVCDVDGTCWQAEAEAWQAFRLEHGRSPSTRDAQYRRGVVALRVVETIEEDETPTEKLARGKVGHPPKMTDEQIDHALQELAEGAVSIRQLARRDWQTWGFKTDRSAEAALRRYRTLRSAQQHHDHQEVAA